jgi:hypothetical protein
MVTVLLVASGLGAANPAFGQAAMARDTDEGWGFVIAPYWLGGRIDGNLRLGEIETGVDLPASYIFERLETGGAAHIEARFGAWGGMFDFSYLRIGDTLSLTETAYVQWKLINFEFDVLASRAIIDQRRRSLEVLGGIRYKKLEMELDFRDDPESEQRNPRTEWVDPVIGARYLHTIHPAVLLVGRGDIGGFGAGSDFTWRARAGGAIYIASGASLLLEFSYTDFDYKEGDTNSSSFFAYDASEYGPLIGFAFIF